jgi:hypothetical protein
MPSTAIPCQRLLLSGIKVVVRDVIDDRQQIDVGYLQFLKYRHDVSCRSRPALRP